MKKINKIILIPFLLLFAFTCVYGGSGTRTGTAGAAQLLIPVGARGIALGGATVATATGVEALFWNPAGVAHLDRSVDVTFSHMNYFADIGIEYGAVSAKIEGLGVLSFNIKALSIGEIPITTTRDPDGTGATFTPQMLVAGATYSRLLTDNISVGVTANFISETLGEVDAQGFAFNVGVIYNNLANINGLSFGVVMKNIGPQMQYGGSGLLIQAQSNDLNRPPQFYQANSAPFELPSTFELGFAYKPTFDEYNALTVSGNYQNNNFSSDEYRVGAEYSYNNLLFLRGGYQFAPQVDSEDYIYGLAAGAGIMYDVGGVLLRVDYAYRDLDILEANHIFQIGLGF